MYFHDFLSCQFTQPHLLMIGSNSSPYHTANGCMTRPTNSCEAMNTVTCKYPGALPVFSSMYHGVSPLLLTNFLGWIKFWPFGFGAAIDLPSLSLSRRPARVTTEPRNLGAVGARIAEVEKSRAVEAREARTPTRMGVLSVAAVCILE